MKPATIFDLTPYLGLATLTFCILGLAVLATPPRAARRSEWALLCAVAACLLCIATLTALFQA